MKPWFRRLLRPVRSRRMLLGGILGVAIGAGGFLAAAAATNPTPFKILAIGLLVVFAGGVVASLFDTRRDRLTIAGIALLLATLWVGSLRPFWWPPSEVDRARASAWTAYFDTVGATVPDVTLSGRDGRPIRLADLQGSWVLLDLWNPESARIEEHLALRRMAHDALADEGLVILAVVPTSTEEQRRILGEREIPYHLVVDDGVLRDALSSPFDWRASYLLDRDGTITDVALDGMLGLHRLARAVRGPDWDPHRDPIPRAP